MIPRPDPRACCDQAYICPSSGDDECLTHGGFDNCCHHPECPGNVRYPATLAGQWRLLKDSLGDLWYELVHVPLVRLLRRVF